jgi:hypothetical protein
MLAKLRVISFAALLATITWGIPAGAFEGDIVAGDDEFGCGVNHYGYYVSNTSQAQAHTYCTTDYTCADFCVATGCGSNVPNANMSASGCTTADPPSGWNYADLAKCDCTPLPR